MLAGAAWAESAPDADKPKLFDAGQLGNRKEPIIVTADTLEYDYKKNVVVYRGRVQAEQGAVKLSSDTLTVTFAQAKDAKDAKDTAGAPAKAADRGTAVDVPGQGGQQLQEIVALGNVRIDSGTRWAVGGRAVFDQTQRTLVLTESPVLHDGSNEVIGDRVVVYLDEDRSIVEGGRKRVKAVLYPDKQPAPAGAAEKRGAAKSSAPSEETTARASAP
jgi:lipopolysaccharide export system protein LptA